MAQRERSEWWHETNRQGNRDRRWKRSLPSPVDGRRCIPVRLSDVPLDTRLTAARVVCASEHPSERPAILAAALYPSDDIHWIAA